MHDFRFRKNELFCENVKVSDIVRTVGSPCYIYSYKIIYEHFIKIKKAFAKIDPLICFAMKANGNSAILKILLDQGAGIDIVSIGELKKALRLNADPKKIVFASVGKTDEEIMYALKKEVLLFNVESIPELENINQIAKIMRKKAKVAIRINPDVEASTHDFITTGTLEKKFGIDLCSTYQLLKSPQKYPFVDFVGLHIHIGSQIVSRTPFINAIKKVVSFINDLRKENISLEYFDIGGGLGIIYKNERPQTALDFAQAILPYLKESGLKIIMEPGRFITGNAGIFVTKVLYLKDNGFKKFLIVDGGMNDFIRPSLYDGYHEILSVKKSNKKKIEVDIVGPICESGDFLGKKRLLPVMNKGDLLAVMGAGAYGYVMASNYNARCRVPEVLVKKDQFSIIKKREKFSDLVRGEVLPDFL